MAIDFSKIGTTLSLKKIKNNALEFVGSPSRFYWPWFLLAFGILLAASIFFGVLLLLTLGSERTAPAVNLAEALEIKINLSGLERATQTLDEKESGLEEALAEPLFGDPSR